MREFFDRLSLRIAEFMNGRYGMDSFSKFLLIVALIIVVFLAFIPFASLVGWIIIGYSLFRILSKNFDARKKENDRFLKIIKGPKSAFKRADKKWKNRKTTLYFKCSGCGTHLSVPKGKGKLRIVCPKCKKEIFKNT